MGVSGQAQFSLQEVADFMNGGPWKQSEYVEAGIPVARVTNFKENSIDLTDCKFLPESSFEKYSKHQLKKGDFVIATVGSHPTQPNSVVGRPVVVPTSASGALLNQNAVRIRAKDGKIDQRFLTYLGQSQQFRDYIIACARGAANQVRMSIGLLKEMPISIPTIEEQFRIASILSTYDDLIENNTRRIQILEEMAQRIYTEWFVHFRFPGHEKVKLMDSKLGRIPSGWVFIRLGDLCSEKTTTVQPDAVDPDTPYVGLEHIPRKSITLENWDNAEKITSTKKTFQVGDILFGKIRPYFHKVSIAPINGITSTDSIVIRADAPDFFPLPLCCTSSVPFVDHATQTSNGTKMPRANWKVLVKYPVPFPNSEILTQFNGFINSIASQTRTLMFKNRNLRQTRDLFLPKLISGEIDVSDIPIPQGIAA